MVLVRGPLPHQRREVAAAAVRHGLLEAARRRFQGAGPQFHGEWSITAYVVCFLSHALFYVDVDRKYFGKKLTTMLFHGLVLRAGVV